MENQTEINEFEAWRKALASWDYPDIPRAVMPKNAEEVKQLGKIGEALKRELAFMKYPEFQTYVNLEKVIDTFKENPSKGLDAITKHETGHRFCPFDSVTAIILQHFAEKGLEGKKLPYNIKKASGLVLNLDTDMNINTNSVRRGDQDLPWVYQIICRDKENSRLWRVYGKSMELAWGKDILPKTAKLDEKELEAAKNLSKLFERDFFDRSKWKESIQSYASIIGDFFESEEKDMGGEGEGDNGGGIDDITKNIPSELDDKTETELAKRLAELGSDGLPSSPAGLKDFQEIMAGFGKGDMIKASINFYEMLSRSYDVMFATRPFGRPRQNPFQPVKWQPSMGADKLDIDYSASLGGKIIPGITTYSWNTRKREIHGGLEEVIPNLDLYLDSSMSTPNPIDKISLLVLAGFVAAKKAHRKGAKNRATNFSGEGQHSTQEWTRELMPIYEELIKYYNGGTVFPVEKMLEDGDPKQVVIITDALLGNRDKTVEAIIKLRRRNSGNRVAVYALHPVDGADYLRNAGAEVIWGTSADIFKKVIGKSQEVYSK